MHEVKEPEVRKAEIIQAAKKLFQSKGYLNVTTQDIVDELKISRGLLYYHYKSKEDILKHIVETETNSVEQRLVAITFDDSISVVNKIGQFIGATIIPSSAYTVENQALQESMRLPENTYMTDQIYRKMSDKMSNYFSVILEQGNNQGVFNVNNPKETSIFLMNAFLSTLNNRDFCISDQNIAKHYLEVFSDILNKILGININLVKYING